MSCRYMSSFVYSGTLKEGFSPEVTDFSPSFTGALGVYLSVTGHRVVSLWRRRRLLQWTGNTVRDSYISTHSRRGTGVPRTSGHLVCLHIR